MTNVYRSDLVQGIAMHDCISFDLHGTLVMRRVPHSSDVFALIEQHTAPQLSFPFCEYRIRSEKELRAQGVAPTLEGIYRHMSQLVSLRASDIEMLMREEYKIECEVMLPRREMTDLLQSACESGKTATVLADTHFSGIQVRDLLQGLGVNVYTMILSAADVGATRETGLYGHYRSLCGEEKRFMHIGDHPVRDGEMARAWGIDTLIIPRPIEQFRRDNPGTTIPQDISSRRILGEKIARQYQSPFA